MIHMHKRQVIGILLMCPKLKCNQQQRLLLDMGNIITDLSKFPNSDQNPKVRQD